MPSVGVGGEQVVAEFVCEDAAQRAAEIRVSVRNCDERTVTADVLFETGQLILQRALRA
jgi:hypothetical protein